MERWSTVEEFFQINSKITHSYYVNPRITNRVEKRIIASETQTSLEKLPVFATFMSGGLAITCDTVTNRSWHLKENKQLCDNSNCVRCSLLICRLCFPIFGVSIKFLSFAQRKKA